MILDKLYWTEHHWSLWLCLVILGMGWGSFATMAVYRLPRNIAWIGAKPYCPSCHHELQFLDYISIISFFKQKGICRYCQSPIGYSTIYLATELACLLVFLICGHILPLGENFLLLTFWGVSFAILAVIYLTHQQLNAKPLLTSMIIASCYRIVNDTHIYGVLTDGILLFVIAYAAMTCTARFSGKWSEHRFFWQHPKEGGFNDPWMSYVWLATLSAIATSLQFAIILLIGTVSLIGIFPKKHPLWILLAITSIWLYAVYHSSIDSNISLLYNDG